MFLTKSSFDISGSAAMAIGSVLPPANAAARAASLTSEGDATIITVWPVPAVSAGGVVGRETDGGVTKDTSPVGVVAAPASVGPVMAALILSTCSAIRVMKVCRSALASFVIAGMLWRWKPSMSAGV